MTASRLYTYEKLSRMSSAIPPTTCYLTINTSSLSYSFEILNDSGSGRDRRRRTLWHRTLAANYESIEHIRSRFVEEGFEKPAAIVPAHSTWLRQMLDLERKARGWLYELEMIERLFLFAQGFRFTPLINTAYISGLTGKFLTCEAANGGCKVEVEGTWARNQELKDFLTRLA
ncbi:MAG: hypothetical protein Q9208_001391 [Pyrenodesmia sp. 3 TL-2023]